MPSERQGPPTVRLRRLAFELRRLRDTAGLTQQQVAEQTGINTATLYRHETARSRPQRRTLIALLNLYGATEQQRTDLLALSREADAQGWLRPYHAELPEQYTAYISFEAEARSVRNYESLFIPGLLQTEDYTRAVIRGGLPMASQKEVEQRVQARMERQNLLTTDNPLRLWAIVDEAALHRLVGGAEVMRQQMNRLISAASEPHVTVQVIAYAAGAHAGMQGSFVLMDFPNPADPEIIHIDSMAGDLFLETQPDVRRYSLLFDNLRAIALSPDDSTRLIASVATGAQ
ncbi:helix-turn-helix transcriptional regulator [Frankia sp. Cr1]|uniref:helix-turn-helix domain-containing protein n=1 Tax=Frankia sp. Cr1 TaxID=3073931 RepID=UPI002AD4EB03|nr:helix-turn-helix transcriptional regulator [Frankia sp. Cr1]